MVATSARHTRHVPIEVADVEDARAIAEIHVRAWRHFYAELLPAALLDGLSVETRAVMWRDAIAGGSSFVWVAREAGAITGFAAFATGAGDGAGDGDGAGACSTVELRAIYLDPACVGTGVGRALCTTGLAAMRARGFSRVALWVFTANARARRFYEAAGFHVEPASARRVVRGGREVDEVRYARALGV